MVCPGGSNKGAELEKEYIADAYAAIRLIQRFGADSEIKNLPAMRAVEMLFCENASHFTLPVVERIIADAKTVDFSALSPQQTVARAVEYAEKYGEKPQMVGFMADAFYALGLNARSLWIRDFAPVRALGDVLLETKIPEQYKWGKTILNAVLEGDIGQDGERMPKPEGAEWAALRQAVEARAAEFKNPQPGIIIVPKL